MSDIGDKGAAPSATVPKGRCIVMVCRGDEADQIRRQLLDQDDGCLLTYRRVEDLVLNAPTGRVALVILSAEDSPARTRRTVQWLRHRWPGSAVTVVSDDAGRDQEMAARQGGAMYLPRAAAGQLSSVVSRLLATGGGAT